METQTDKENHQNGQLLSVNRKDTTRLLEVFIKRSLSLNDSKLVQERSDKGKARKWVTFPERHKRIRRHSSDPSIHLAYDVNKLDVGTFAAVEAPAVQQETAVDTSEKKSKKKKKKKKASLWKSFLGFFSRKGSEEKEEEQESCPETSDVVPSQEASVPPATPNTSRRKKSLRRRFSKRRLTLRKSSKRDPRKENAVDITGVESVEPTYSYYEKVSEEMEKIVYEVKEKETLQNEEVIKRIIALTKQQGDAIDEKLKENPILSNFFQRMSYTCFQQLADTYVETEMIPTERDHATVLPTAPELVKLAFTLDFTARVAGLSRQNVGHITGLGTRYLEDRFAYQQACTDHPWSDIEDYGD